MTDFCERIPAGVYQQMEAIFADRLSMNKDIREQHSHGEDYHTPGCPEVVCYAQTTDEVSQLLRLCNQHRIPVVPFGVGTSVEGHVVATRGGVSLDLSLMTQILEINQLDMDARIECGVTRQQLNQDLRDSGLFFSVDPGAEATIGGMVATRASGTNTVRYGTIRENVLGLTLVMANGDIIKTGTRARKSAAGYDLTRLIVGSEGTLAVVTEIQIRLHPQPESICAAVSQFDTLKGAVDTVIEVLQHAVPMARIELLDAVQMDACIKYSSLDGYLAAPTLFMEFHGTEASVVEQANLVEQIAKEQGASNFKFARLEEDRNRLWKARHAAYYAGCALAPGSRGLTTDVCVPLSSLVESIETTRLEIEQSGLIATILGHVGDGNYHVLILIDPEDSDQLAKAQILGEGIVQRALACGGTCTGEHGIGIGKREYLRQEEGQGVEMMRLIKTALDPNGILNPDKIFE